MLGKMENPSVMLEETYYALQSELILVRQAVTASVDRERKLELQIKDMQSKGEDTAALESQLVTQKETTNTLKQRLTELEQEVQKAYTKKQVLIARDQASRATSEANRILSERKDPWTLINEMENRANSGGAPSKKTMLVLVAVLFVWLLIFIYVAIKHMNP